MALIHCRHIQTVSTLVCIIVSTLARFYVLRYQRHDFQWPPIHHILQYIFLLSLWRILFVLLGLESNRSILYLGSRRRHGCVALTWYIL